ncbi:hypothetical protein ACFQU2_06985 [Siccirubricoccus deserti]
MRHGDPDCLTRMGEALAARAAEVSAARKVTATVTPFWHSPLTPFDTTLVQRARDSAKARGLNYHEMPTGIGHDAVYLARKVPVVMVFTPATAASATMRRRASPPNGPPPACRCWPMRRWRRPGWWAGEPPLSPDRLWDRLMAMARIGATPEGGNNRPALSALDGEARALLARWGGEIGLTLSVDRLGNMALRRRAGTPPARQCLSAAISIPSPRAAIRRALWRAGGA